MYYDSDYEYKLALNHNITLNHHKFSDHFYDKNRDSFRAICDTTVTKDEHTYYIEFKSCALNTMTSQSSCYNKLANQCMYRNIDLSHLPYITHYSLSAELWRSFDYRNDSLKYGWNHSKNKHKIIANEYGDRYIIVFESHPKTITYSKKELPFKEHYLKYYGLSTMLLEDYKTEFC